MEDKEEKGRALSVKENNLFTTNMIFVLRLANTLLKDKTSQV